MTTEAAQNVRPIKPLSLFPTVALLVLDGLVVIAFLISLVLLVMGVSGHLGLNFSVNGQQASKTAKRLLSLPLFGIPGVFFWLAHLVLVRTRYGQPFERRNVKLLYWMASLLLVAALSNGLQSSYASSEETKYKYDDNGKVLESHVEKTPPVLKMGYSDNYKNFPDFLFNSGVSYSLLLFAFAAIFQRGVEVREEEQRLREEQALTV